MGKEYLIMQTLQDSEWAGRYLEPKDIMFIQWELTLDCPLALFS